MYATQYMYTILSCLSFVQSMIMFSDKIFFHSVEIEWQMFVRIDFDVVSDSIRRYFSSEKKIELARNEWKGTGIFPELYEYYLNVYCCISIDRQVM